MKKLISIMYFLILFFNINLIQANELEDKLFNKTYKINGIFVKYDFANVESSWDFVYISYDNNSYYQLQGDKRTDKNPFGWKVISKLDGIDITKPAFYFTYLGDINKDNKTSYNWIAITPSTQELHKLNGRTSSGYFAWNKLQNTSITLDTTKNTVSFYKTLSPDGNKITDTNINNLKLPQFPNQPDFFNDKNNTNKDDTNKDDTTKKDDNNNDIKNENNTSTDSNDKKDSSSDDDTNKQTDNSDKISDDDSALKKKCDKIEESKKLGDSPPGFPSAECQAVFEKYKKLNK